MSGDATVEIIAEITQSLAAWNHNRIKCGVDGLHDVGLGEVMTEFGTFDLKADEKITIIYIPEALVSRKTYQNI